MIELTCLSDILIPDIIEASAYNFFGDNNKIQDP